MLCVLEANGSQKHDGSSKKQRSIKYLISG